MKTYVLTLSTKFPATHYLREQETNFFQKIKDGTKIHTIRANFPLWKKRFEKINAGEACLSIRYWTGKPYASKQEEFLKLTKDDGIGMQELGFPRKRINDAKVLGITEKPNDCVLVWNNLSNYHNNYDTSYPSIQEISSNDGLDFDDFKEWFKSYDLFNPLAIIHFTKFRY